ALKAGARMIGVNNRDLRTFRTSLETSERLIAEAPRDRVMISESGLQDGKSLRHLQTLGFRGFLVGEALMRATDPETALRDLIATAGAAQSFPTQIKICGITNALDAQASVRLGANMIGFNFYPRSPRYITPEAARQIVEALPDSACAVGVFVDADAQQIRKSAELAGVRCVQLHGHTTPETCSEFAHEFRVIRAFTTNAQFQARDAAAFPDCDVLVDAYHPELRGGTGQTCDWSVARSTLAFTRFLILSGGLNAKNVGQAIAVVTPHAIDVCSGIESAPGVKDLRAIKDFMVAVRAAKRSARAASTHESPPQCHLERSEGSRICSK